MIQKITFFFIFLLITLLGCKSDKAILTKTTPTKTVTKNTLKPTITNTDIIIHRLQNLTKSDELLHSFEFKDSILNWSLNDSVSYLLNIDSITKLNSEQKIEYFKHLTSSTSNFYSSQALPFVFDSTNKLTGIRIALDPGHSAGSLEEAKIEGKYLEFKQSENTELNKDYSLIESELNFHTAFILKQKLEKQGAIVFLTRDKIGYASMGYSYEYWYKHKFDTHLDSLLDINELDNDEYAYFKKLKKRDTEYCQKVIFNRLFNAYDFKTRAQKINAFQPHITLVLHYNVDVKNDPWTSPTTNNRSMAFIPGGFMSGELDHADDQFHFLRLLFSNQQEQSLQLSEKIIHNIENEAQVQPATPLDSIPYLLNYCEPTPTKGVYYRNLALTRTLNGILCYAEPLYQDNIDEIKSLQEKDVLIDEFYTYKRVETIANAYYNGIIHFLTETKKRD